MEEIALHRYNGVHCAHAGCIIVNKHLHIVPHLWSLCVLKRVMDAVVPRGMCFEGKSEG